MPKKISEIHGVRLRYMGLPVKSVPENDSKSAQKRLQKFANFSGYIFFSHVVLLPYLIALNGNESSVFSAHGRFPARNRIHKGPDVPHKSNWKRRQSGRKRMVNRPENERK